MRETSAGRAVVVVALVFAGRSTSAQVRIEPLPPAVPTHTATPAAPLTHWADRLGYRSAAPRSAPPEPDGSVRCSVAVVLPDSLALVEGQVGLVRSICGTPTADSGRRWFLHQRQRTRLEPASLVLTAALCRSASG